MTFGSTFPQRLSKIDALTLPDHRYLDATDECYFLSEYTARHGVVFGETSRLLLDLRLPVQFRGQPRYRGKAAAIAGAARGFAAVLDPEWLDGATLVPVPAAKAHDDPLYDDRLMQMLCAIRSHPPLDIRELLVRLQPQGMGPDLQAQPSPGQIAHLYRVDPLMLTPAPQVIGIFGDVLATGAHFKAAQMVLRQQFPSARIVGLFVGRSVPGSVSPDQLGEV